MTSSSAPTPLGRLRRLAAVLRLLVLVGALGVLAVPLVLAFMDPGEFERAARAWWPGALSVGSAAQGWVVVAVSAQLALWLAALGQAWRLFSAYGRGDVFGEVPAGALRWLGVLLMANAVARPLRHAAVVIALTWNNPSGLRQLSLGVSGEDYLSLLLGGLLLALAVAMAEARRIEQDNAGFV